MRCALNVNSLTTHPPPPFFYGLVCEHHILYLCKIFIRLGGKKPQSRINVSLAKFEYKKEM